MNAGNSKFEDSGIGPILSPFMNKEKVTNFCNEFNSLSKAYKKNLPLRVFFCLFFDNSFFFIIKGINISFLLKLILNLDQFHIQKNEVLILDFYLLLFLKCNLIDYKKKEFFNKHYFLSLFSTINSLKNIVIKNEFNT